MRPPISPDLEFLSRDELEAEVRRLRGHSASLAQMFEQAPSFIALLSGPEHRFTLTNAAYTRVIGDRDVTGRTVSEALPEAIAQGYVDLLDEVFRTGETHRATAAPFQVQATSGGSVNERYLDFVYQPITDARGAVNGIFVEGHDVIERARAEAALRESEARYRTLFETIEVGFCIVEIRFEGSRAVDYRIVEAILPSFGRRALMLRDSG
jgi:PAS domain-containing protein